MEKTYWWRIATLLLSVLGIVIGYALFYPYQYGLCNSFVETCFFGGFKKTIAEPLVLIALSFSVISPFLFFINDIIFKKWLRFGMAWFFLTAILILISPEYSGGFGPSLNPTKESVSIWMSSLFVIISLILIAREKLKMKREV